MNMTRPRVQSNFRQNTIIATKISMKMGMILNRMSCRFASIITAGEYEQLTYLERVVDRCAAIENAKDFSSLSAGME